MPKSVKMHGKDCKRIGKGHTCSCCGAADNGVDWFVYRAGWCDVDGIYMARLCGDKHGEGCLSEVPPAKSEKNEVAQMLCDLMPGEEDDGVQSMLEDYDYIHGE